jgi:hypothetical protein
MDFSSQYQFAGSQPYQGGFMAMPPLTPSHSQSASDDYNANNTSPPVRYLLPPCLPMFVFFQVFF